MAVLATRSRSNACSCVTSWRVIRMPIATPMSRLVSSARSLRAHLDALITAHRELAALHGRFVITNVSPQLRRLLTITGLDAQLLVQDTAPHQEAGPSDNLS